MRPCRFFVVICISVILLSFSCNLDSLATHSQRVTGILGALDEEVEILEEQLENKNEKEIEGIRFIKGKLKGRSVVIARTGIGKVNAAMTTTLLLEHFKPKQVIFSGIAGGLNPELFPGDIVIAEKTAQHDLGILRASGLENEGVINPFTGEQNPVFFPADKKLLELAEQAARSLELKSIKPGNEERAVKVITGVIVTGDVFAASSAKCIELREKFGADAVEMEGAAVAQICYQRGIPHLVVRCISDKADEKAVEDVRKFLKVAARNSARLTTKIIELLSSEVYVEK